MRRRNPVKKLFVVFAISSEHRLHDPEVRHWLCEAFSPADAQAMVLERHPQLAEHVVGVKGPLELQPVKGLKGRRMLEI